MKKIENTLTTGELARKTDVSLRTVRWYAEKGLVKPLDSQGSSAAYPFSAVNRVKKIRFLALMGLKLSEISDLLKVTRNLRTEKKEKTLFLRGRIEQMRSVLKEKEDVLRSFRSSLDTALEQTKRCPECPSRGKNRDCAPCPNLQLLEYTLWGEEEKYG